MNPQTYSQHLFENAPRKTKNYILTTCPDETTLHQIAQNLTPYDTESCTLLTQNQAAGTQIISWANQLPDNPHDNYTLKQTAINGLVNNPAITTQQLLDGITGTNWTQTIIQNRTLTEQQGLTLLQQTMKLPDGLTRQLHQHNITEAILKTNPKPETIIFLLNLPQTRVGETAQWAKTIQHTQITDKLQKTAIQQIKNDPEEHLQLITGLAANNTTTNQQQTQLADLINQLCTQNPQNLTRIGQHYAQGLANQKNLHYTTWKKAAPLLNPNKHTSQTITLIQAAILNVNQLTCDELLQAANIINASTPKPDQLQPADLTVLLLKSVHTKLTSGTTQANLTITKLAKDHNIQLNLPPTPEKTTQTKHSLKPHPTVTITQTTKNPAKEQKRIQP